MDNMHDRLHSLWRNQTAFMPDYPSHDELKSVVSILSKKSALIPLHEIDSLKKRLEGAIKKEDFILQLGDCAESFSSNTQQELMAFMNMVNSLENKISSALRIPVTTIGRIAGQYAKPRSEEHEIQNGTTLHPFRGELINSIHFTPASRQANPRNLLLGYHAAKETLRHLKHLQYKNSLPEKNSNLLYTSHESLLLAYDVPMTRNVNQQFYNLSTHFPWLGTRTAIKSQVHTEYFETISNPIGIKINPNMPIRELVQLVQRLNPHHIPARITCILRLGARPDNTNFLIELLDSLGEIKHQIVWMCDPMHGNTKKIQGKKIRIIEDMLSEMLQTTQILNNGGTHLSGLHFEASADPIHECFWNHELVHFQSLSHYTSLMDPRIQCNQLHDLLNLYFNQDSAVEATPD